MVGEYLEAYRSAGIDAGLYFSMLDLTAGIGKQSCTKEQLEYKEQLYELLTRYGKIPFLVIDGWNAEWGGPFYSDMPFEEIDEFVKKIQPDSTAELKSAEWALKKIKDMNAHNVSFLIKMSPNRFGLVDDNLAERLKEIGSQFNHPDKLDKIPAEWMRR